MPEPVRIVEAGGERIPELEPLWTAMFEHHRAVAPHLADVRPFRPAADSWAIRRGRYERWLAQPGSFLLLAERDGGAVGYALVTLGGTEATLVAGQRVAELMSLALLPDERGAGAGGRLMEAVYTRLAAAGVHEVLISVMEGNEGALRFYGRFGAVPYMRTLVGRVPPARD